MSRRSMSSNTTVGKNSKLIAGGSNSSLGFIAKELSV